MSLPFYDKPRMTLHRQLLYSNEEVIAFLEPWDSLNKNTYYIGVIQKPLCDQCETKEFTYIHRWYNTTWNTRYCLATIPYCSHSEWVPRPYMVG